MYHDGKKRCFDPFEFKDFSGSIRVVRSFWSRFVEGEGLVVYHSLGELAVYYELAYGYHDVPSVDGYIIHAGIFEGGSLSLMGLGLLRTKSTRMTKIFRSQ